MKKTIGSFVLRMATMALLAGSGSLCSAASIVLAPSTNQVDVGSGFTVDVLAKDLNLGGFDLTLAFAPLLTSFDSVDFGPYLGAPMSFQSADAQIDTVTLDELSFEDSTVLAGLQGAAGTGNQFTLATLHFTALAQGTAAFNIRSSFLTDLQGDTISADLTGAEVQVNGGVPVPPAVPEPGELSMIGLGGGVMLIMARLRGRIRRPSLS